MEFIPLKRRHVRKPNKPELDYSSTLMRSHAFSNTFSDRPERAEGKVKPVWVNNAVTQVATTKGIGAHFASSDSSDAEYINDDLFGDAWNAVFGTYAAAPITVSFGIKADDVTPGDQLGIFEWGFQNGTNGLYIFLDTNGDLTCAVGTFNVNNITHNLTQSKWYDCVYTVDAAGASALYVNGVKVGTNTGSSTSAPTSSFKESNIGTVFNGAFGNSFHGDMSYLHLFGRAFNEAEGLALSANPNIVYKPYTQLIEASVPVAAATGSYLIPLKRRHTRKPNYPAGVNWGNPLSKGLAAVIIHLPHINSVYDAVSGRLYSGEATSLEVKDGERQLKFDGSNDYFKIPLDIGAESTIFTKVYSEVLTGGTHLRAATLSDSTTTNVRVSLGRVVSGYARVNNNDGTNNNIVDSAYTINTSPNPYSICSVQQSGQPITAYINGVYDDGSARGTTTNASNLTFSGLDTLTIGAVTFSTGQQNHWNNHISVVVVYDRCLSATEVRELNHNPYQILQPYTQYIEAGAAAAEESGFNPFWAANATITQSMQGFS